MNKTGKARVQIFLPPDLLAELDVIVLETNRHAMQDGAGHVSRSEVIETAIRSHLATDLTRVKSMLSSVNGAPPCQEGS